MKLAIVGGGAAGTAAAWAARRIGAQVTVFHGRPGATALYSGALDSRPWEDGRPDESLDSDVLAFATAMEAWSVGTRSARVVTYEGVLRPARGIDSALLDVAPLSGRTIGVADSPIEGWDARAVVRALSATPWAASTRTRFEAIPVSNVVGPDESRASWFDIAMQSDVSAHVARLAEGLERASSSVDGWLFGSWLGTGLGSAERLSSLVGKPCGETTSPPGGAAGARFEASRDALLSSVGARVETGPIERIVRRGARFLPIGKNPEMTARETAFDALVLAVGGLVAGGIVLEGGDVEHPSRFRCPLVADAFLGLDGRLIDHTSSVHGVDLVALGMRALERVGIMTNGDAAAGTTGLFAAGDCVADRPRCALEAVRSGIAAARAAVAITR